MKDKSLFLILAIIFLVLAMLYMSFCSPQLIPGTPYEPEDPDVTGEDIYEDDDTYSAASTISVGSTQDHTIYGEGDIDYIKFLGESGITYRINLSNIKGFEPEMSLYESDGTTLIEMKNTGTYTDTYDWWGYDSSHNYSEDEKESIIFIAEADSYYYVSVKDIYDAHSLGSYTIRVHKIIDVGSVDNLVATADSQDFEIDVSWGSITGVDGYYLYRTDVPQDIYNPNYSDFILIKTLSSTSYSDNTIQPDVTYYYYIKGYIETETGDPSNVDDAIFNWGEFKPYNTIEASQGLPNRIEIVLKKVYPNDQTYEIYRAKAEDVPVGEEDDISHYTHISGLDFDGSANVDDIKTNGVTGETIYDVNDLEADKYYYYKVRVVLTGGNNSDYSWLDSGLAD